MECALSMSPMFPGLGMYYTDPAQLIVTVGYPLDDLNDLSADDLYDLSVDDVSDLSVDGLSDISVVDLSVLRVQKSEVPPNPKINLFSKGQIQNIVRPIMHRGK